MLQPDWAPSVADVGSVLRARTKDRNGNELGTFTEATRPTGEQVDDLIETAVADLSAECGIIPDLIQDNARRVAALGASCLVELSYFPEQINSGRSAYSQMQTRYVDALSRLKLQVSELQNDGTLNNDDLLPQFNFDDCGMIGLRTQW